MGMAGSPFPQPATATVEAARKRSARVRIRRDYCARRAENLCRPRRRRLPGRPERRRRSPSVAATASARIRRPWPTRSSAPRSSASPAEDGDPRGRARVLRPGVQRGHHRGRRWRRRRPRPWRRSAGPPRRWPPARPAWSWSVGQAVPRPGARRGAAVAAGRPRRRRTGALDPRWLAELWLAITDRQRGAWSRPPPGDEALGRRPPRRGPAGAQARDHRRPAAAGAGRRGASPTSPTHAEAFEPAARRPPGRRRGRRPCDTRSAAASPTSTSAGPRTSTGSCSPSTAPAPCSPAAPTSDLGPLRVDDLPAVERLVAQGTADGLLRPADPARGGPARRRPASAPGWWAAATSPASSASTTEPYAAERMGEVACLYTVSRFSGSGAGGLLDRRARSSRPRADGLRVGLRRHRVGRGRRLLRPQGVRRGRATTPSRRSKWDGYDADRLAAGPGLRPGDRRAPASRARSVSDGSSDHGTVRRMDLRFSDEDEAFRAEARSWLTEQLDGDFAGVRGRGGPGDEHALFDERLAWEQHLGASGWTCVGWPKEHGGRGLTPAPAGHLVRGVRPGRRPRPPRPHRRGPGRPHDHGLRRRRPAGSGSCPPIVAGTELWAQGYSEPNAGSDLANVPTRAEPDGDDWRITGQKVWTSLAHWSDWCFVLARTDRDAQPKHRGISYFLVPLRQDGIEIRPIRQVTGTAEFNEVFFDGALAKGVDVVGGVDNGWKVAMGTLAFERGASTLGQQLAFRNELDDAHRRRPAQRPHRRPGHPPAAGRGRTAASRSCAGTRCGCSPAPTAPPRRRAAMITKLYWATWHRDLGELAMDVARRRGAARRPGRRARRRATSSPPLQRLFLFTRADTIYAGSNQIQRNIIGERALGLPAEPRTPAPMTDPMPAPDPTTSPATACSPARPWWSPPPPAPASAPPSPARPSRRAPPSSSATSTSGASARPPTAWPRRPAPGPPPRSATSPSRTTCRACSTPRSSGSAASTC